MIYFTDTDPDEAASNLCDRHLRKTVTFSLRAVREALENRTQQSDPYVRWACENRHNLKWVVDHAHSAIHEIYYRFRKCMPHENTEYLVYANSQIGIQTISKFLTPLPNDIGKVREYYRTQVAPKSRWTKRFPPDWINE